ncbi:hypothetical protein RRG08_064924 [Elysia crispata]|uniref:Uncharacterized protein n=1 Tax=Elysia crispata TaxID=231223 RepID=A0AAE1CJK7_9GAST|nr:hypothetical protein RRG08_064924 [Elysia crispata]
MWVDALCGYTESLSYKQASEVCLQTETDHAEREDSSLSKVAELSTPFRHITTHLRSHRKCVNQASPPAHSQPVSAPAYSAVSLSSWF